MHTKSMLLILAAVSMTFGAIEAQASVSMQVGSPNLNFSISDYQPAPANVYVYNDGGRPYYVERDRRVYMERKHHGKKYKKEKRYHDEDRGHDEGHGRGNGRGH